MFTAVVFAALFGLSLAKPLISPAGPFELFRRLTSSCSNTGPVSCSSSAAGTCCFEAPGGLLLQTQFWDTNPSTGPSDSWTIHGIQAVDFSTSLKAYGPTSRLSCDGTFEENCDPSRDYTGIATLLTNQGASDTLSFMNTFWVDINGQNEQFWEHEWATHGTCYSTLETKCLPSGSPRGAEAVSFFTTTVNLFKTVPTYQFLENAGITPSTTQTFTLSTLISALKTGSGGFTPALDCSSGSISAISWYFNIKGSLMNGTFVPINAPKAGSCPSSGIKYPPKSGSSTTTSTSPSGTPTGPPGTLPTKATIHASTTGGLLSAGTWSTQTLATYTLSGTTSSFTLTSSKGSCGVSGGAFSCGSGVTSTHFSAVTSGSTLLLASGGSTSFSSDGTPSGTVQLTVFTGSSHSTSYTLGIVGS